MTNLILGVSFDPPPWTDENMTKIHSAIQQKCSQTNDELVELTAVGVPASQFYKTSCSEICASPAHQIRDNRLTVYCALKARMEADPDLFSEVIIRN